MSAVFTENVNTHITSKSTLSTNVYTVILSECTVDSTHNYILHPNMDTTHYACVNVYVCVDVLLEISEHKMLYYTMHRHKGAHHVCADVL
jgi:hypothetical protein